MRIAIPTSDGLLEEHFGHCEAFTVAEVDPDRGTIDFLELEVAPAHAPGVLPPWLRERGVGVVIAGNMGARAQELLRSLQIEVLTGAPPLAPEALIGRYLAGELVSIPRTCQHSHADGSDHKEGCHG